MTLSNRIRALLIASAALLALPAAARAGTVSVEEVLTGGENLFTESTLHFVAAPGEANELVVTIAAPAPKDAPPGTLEHLQIIDSGAPLSAGRGCEGSGAVGGPVLCEIPAPHAQGAESCGKDCSRLLPGTGFEDALKVELGDADDSFDASTLGDSDENHYTMTVSGGAGDDRITTGPGVDLVEPGPGEDEVHLGPGYGTVVADPQPDGNDLIDGGGQGRVDYTQRSVMSPAPPAKATRSSA